MSLNYHGHRRHAATEILPMYSQIKKCITDKILVNFSLAAEFLNKNATVVEPSVYLI